MKKLNMLNLVILYSILFIGLMFLAETLPKLRFLLAVFYVAVVALTVNIKRSH